MLLHYVTCFWAGSNCISSDFYDLSSTVNEVRSPKSVSTSVVGATLHTNLTYIVKINVLIILFTSILKLKTRHQKNKNVIYLHFFVLLQKHQKRISQYLELWWSWIKSNYGQHSTSGYLPHSWDYGIYWQSYSIHLITDGWTGTYGHIQL